MVHRQHFSTISKDEPRTMHHYDFSYVKCPPYTELVCPLCCPLCAINRRLSVSLEYRSRYRDFLPLGDACAASGKAPLCRSFKKVKRNLIAGRAGGELAEEAASGDDPAHVAQTDVCEVDCEASAPSSGTDAEADVTGPRRWSFPRHAATQNKSIDNQHGFTIHILTPCEQLTNKRTTFAAIHKRRQKYVHQSPVTYKRVRDS